MSDIVLTIKGERLVELCKASGFKTIDELLRGALRSSACPAICMECGTIGELKREERRGECKKCGQRRVVSGLVLAGFLL